jgi:hypothetical protein
MRVVPIVVCTFVMCAAINRGAAFAQGPMLQLGQLAKLGEKAKEVVDVTVDEAMLQSLSGLLAAKSNPGVQAMAGLKGVYVKSFEFENEGGYAEADVDAVTAQLKAPWSKILSVREAGERTEMYLWRDGDAPGGLALIVAEKKELTIINLVGRIDLAQLSSLGGLMGIPGNVMATAAAVQGSAANDGKAQSQAPTREKDKKK